MVDYLSREFRDLFVDSEGHPLGIHEIAEIMLSEDAQTQDALWPQLWAMQQVEPLVSDLLEDVYAEYLQLLEKAFEAEGSQSPRAEAICLMALLESEALFTG